MILTLTNSEDATANYLIPVLEDAGIAVLRLDTDTLISNASVSLSDGCISLTVQGHRLVPEDVAHLWYRRPERLRLNGIDESPESRFAINEWSEAIEGFLAQIPRHRWMNHPAANVAASNKLEQLSTARVLGLVTPGTLLTQDAATARRFAQQFDGLVIAKPLSNGYIERTSGDDSLIYTNVVQANDLAADASEFASCPTLFQQYVRKQYDVRITAIDDTLHAVALYASGGDGQQRCDIRRNNMNDVVYQNIDLPSGVALTIRQLVKHYGLRFAAIDMAVDLDGNWVFFEVNSNGQWAWLDISAGMRIADSFVRAFSDV